MELQDLHSDETVKYQIVGDLEADIKLRMISVSSPVARALIGKSEGDTVHIETPGGRKSFEVVEVKYEV